MPGQTPNPTTQRPLFGECMNSPITIAPALDPASTPPSRPHSKHPLQQQRTLQYTQKIVRTTAAKVDVRETLQGYGQLGDIGVLCIKHHQLQGPRPQAREMGNAIGSSQIRPALDCCSWNNQHRGLIRSPPVPAVPYPSLGNRDETRRPPLTQSAPTSPYPNRIQSC